MYTIPWVPMYHLIHYPSGPMYHLIHHPSGPMYHLIHYPSGPMYHLIHVAIFKLDFLYLLLLYYAQELQFADFNRYLDVFYTPES